MRHCNPKSSSRFTHYRGHHVNEPYNSEYINAYGKNGFATTATPKKRYVQVLQYIADHDGCKLHDVKCAVWKLDPKSSHRGFWSNGFSQLLYIDVIDYDKNFRYHITERGRRVLGNAYINDIIKMVTSK